MVVDTELTLWKLNLVVFAFQNNYSAKVKKGRELEKNWKDAKGEESLSFDSAFAPSFNIARYWNENKETVMGIIAGIIPGGQGVSLYFTQEYFEALSILASFEAILFNGDSQAVK